MYYLTPAETLQHGWSLYWARTMREWDANTPIPRTITPLECAKAKYDQLFKEYGNNLFSHILINQEETAENNLDKEV